MTMVLGRSNRKDFTKREVHVWELILSSVKKNFVLEPTPEDSFVASKSIEGVKTMPHLVIFFLCYNFNVPIELMILHFDLTDKKFKEFSNRLCIGIHKNDVKLLRKIEICKSYIDRKL